MRVNYLGSVYCTHYALPHLKASHGQIVGVSSLTGKNGVPTRSGYAASKHAMVGFFDTLRIELAPDGVSVTMIYPGFVATEARKRAFGPRWVTARREPGAGKGNHDRGRMRRPDAARHPEAQTGTGDDAAREGGAIPEVVRTGVGG